MFPVAVAFDSEGTLDNTMNYYEITFSDPFLPVLAVPVQDGHSAGYRSLADRAFSPAGPCPTGCHDDPVRHNPDDFPEEQRDVIRMLNVVLGAFQDGRLPGLQMCSPEYAARQVRVTIWPDDQAVRDALAELLPPGRVQITVQKIDARAY